MNCEENSFERDSSDSGYDSRRGETREVQGDSTILPQTNLSDAGSFQTDGRVQSNEKDPPGQRSVYINPGDPEKEVYRLSTFYKFPLAVRDVLDVRILALHGFLYTGYKDRVRCFSCGSNVTGWTVGDDPRDKKWHLSDCPLVLGLDTFNKPIGRGRLQFSGRFPTLNQSVESGYGSLSSSSIGNDSLPRRGIVTADERPADMTRISNNFDIVQIGNNNNISITTNKAVHQSARVVSTVVKTTNYVQDLDMANITSKDHKYLITVTLNLHKEDDRRKSFSSWTMTYVTVTPNALAKSGFFFLGNADRVQCFACSGVLRNWRSDDDVEFEHRRHFPRCRMVLRIESRNIPLEMSLDKENGIVEPPDPSAEEQERLNREFPCLNPVNPHMRDQAARIQSFDERWPRQKIRASVKHISKAGFFSLGERDRAKCWYCNGGLQNWDADDEPFFEHAKWFPGCEFILRTKGVDFVQKITEEFRELKRPTLRNPHFDPRSGQLLVKSTPNLPRNHVAETGQAAHMSAGAVLQNYSPSRTPPRGNSQEMPHTPINSTMEADARTMGFTDQQIENCKRKMRRERGRSFQNSAELINALLDDSNNEVEMQDPLDDVPPSHLPEDDTSMESMSSFREEPEQALAEKEANPQKRNSDLPSNANGETSSENMDFETPAKVLKTAESQKLTEELSVLERIRLCKACFFRKADTVVLMCGHLSLCADCSKNAKRCPLCNEKIHSKIKAYLA